MNPLMTIIIPTRERADTLKFALKTATAQTYSKLEIIVSDNASSSATRDVVEAENDPRIRYINTGQRVSMTRNYEFALSHATGEWISMIGDDDGILPTGIERGLGLLNKTKTLALSCVPAYYEWPGFRETSKNGYLKIKAGKGFNIVDYRKHMIDLISGRLDFTKSPMFYTGGIIHRSIYDSLKDKSEFVLNSFNPDIYSIFAIASSTDKFVQSLEPLMITGRSLHSTGASSVGTSADLFFSEEPLPWHSGLADPARHAMTRSMWLYESFLQTEFLRVDNPISYNPIDQLQIASKEFFVHPRTQDERSIFNDWKGRFLQYYNINDTATGTTLFEPVKKFIDNQSSRIKNMLQNYILTDQNHVPLRTVFDASIAAQCIADTPPSRLGNMVKTGGRALGW